MKIFAIRDADNYAGKDLAYLIYFEKEKSFYIELPDDADPWEVPLLLSSFLKRGETTVNAYWSRIWVQQRIVPPDRQNLGQILRDNGLDEYDEYQLLMLSDGRCPQDSCYLTPISESDLPAGFADRYQKRIEDVIPLSDWNLLVFFRNGIVKKCLLPALTANNPAFAPILSRKALFEQIQIQPGGYGISWGEHLTVSDRSLYENGTLVPLSLDDFKQFVACRAVNIAEAAELLDCSRQNIDDLIRRKKLHPLKTNAKNRLLLKSEVLQRKSV